MREVLEAKGISSANVSINNQTVSFEGDRKLAKSILTKKGYPEEGSPEAKSSMKKAKFYVSCMIGKTKK